MKRFVLEPVLFAIFSELLEPIEPIEYVIPYVSVIELYDLKDSDQVVMDLSQDARVKGNIEQLIAFFEQPFVRKKMERTLKVPWMKSAPILFSETVTITVVNSLDNAEFGEAFDPVETELLLTARREQLPIISDQLEFQKRVHEARIGLTVIDVAEIGFRVDEDPFAASQDEEFGSEDYADEPLAPFEAQEGALSGPTPVGHPSSVPSGTSYLPWVMGGLLLLLVGSLVWMFLAD
ncbi:MAG TPA: ADP-heptose synthase [Bacilli bacterium]|nr:ADP-heptose synthase [Bacilli bacterium]